MTVVQILLERTFGSVNTIILGKKLSLSARFRECNNIFWVTIRAASLLQVR